MLQVNILLFIFLLIRTVNVSCRDLSESERAARAAFVQRLVNKQRYLEGRVRLIGGGNKFEGKPIFYWCNIEM